MQTRKPRVLLVGPLPPTTGGVTTYMLNVMNSPLLREFEMGGYNTSRPPKRNVLHNLGYGALFRGGFGKVVIGMLVTIRNVLVFPFALIARRPDVIQVQASDFLVFWEATTYVSIARLLRVPVVMRIGGSFDRFYEASSEFGRAAIRFALGLPDRLIVQSGYWRDFIATLGRSQDVAVLPNSVRDDLVFDRRTEGASPPVCLFLVGSDATTKGFEEVLEAAKVLKASAVPVRIRCIAAPDALRDRVHADGLSEIVDVCGTLSHEGTMAAMREADIFLLPSRSEGFPNSLVEAMAAGLPVIVTPVGAIPEIVGSQGAIVVPVQDPVAIADAVARLARDTAERERLGKAACTIVRTRYTNSAVQPQLGDVWRGLLGKERLLQAEAEAAP